MNKNFAAITSMDENYYKNCGRTMLRSYKSHWSHLMPLYVYNENSFQIKVKTVQTMGFALGDAYHDFQARHKNDKVKQFAKKAFPIIDAMNKIDCDRLVWLDADTVIRDNVPHQLLDLVSPEDVLSTHFDVWHWKDNKQYHSCETGFFILNTRHPGFKEFRDVYTDIYLNDKSEDLRRFYDGEVYGKTVRMLEEKGNKMLNLNPGRHKTPISRSVIAPYVTHFKAGLKDKVDFDSINDTFEDEDDD